jgi:hypothetical protein
MLENHGTKSSILEKYPESFSFKGKIILLQISSDLCKAVRVVFILLLNRDGAGGMSLIIIRIVK